jgi:hypothetical protein
MYPVFFFKSTSLHQNFYYQIVKTIIKSNVSHSYVVAALTVYATPARGGRVTPAAVYSYIRTAVQSTSLVKLRLVL